MTKFQEHAQKTLNTSIALKQLTRFFTSANEL